MREKTTICKRIFLMFLVVWITFISVFGAYQKSVEAAEWVAGTIAAIGGAPILSALLIGGVVVAGGIAVYELSQTTPEDHRNFVNGIKTGFQEFVADREKQIALEQDSSLTDQQAADRGVAAARDTVNNFADNALNVVRTTGKNLKTKTIEYWNSFCKDINNVADNGLSGGVGIPSPTNPVQVPINNNSLGYNPPMTDSNNTFFSFQDRYYILSGEISGSNITGTNTSTFIQIPFMWLFPYNDGYYYNASLFNIWVDNGNISSVGVSVQSSYHCNLSIISRTTVPIIYNESEQNIKNNFRSLLSIAGAGSVAPLWLRTIKDTMDNTHIGESIRSGRRAKLQSGDYIGSTFVEDSLPIKKTALRVGDTTTVGKVGWDIPQPDIWDDVYSGGRPFSDVVRDTGVIGVPSDDVTSYPTDTEVEFPTDTDVQDVDDVIDIPVDDEIDIDDEIEIPERPLPDIIEDQEGDFYPTEMDITQLFPFCIPFDIIYLVEKFDVSGANAPVITLPLKYPNAIRGAMGSDRYVVTIDLADYVIVRDVIRVFLLLLFIAGLMKITRDLIRG